ncbi:MAG: sigma-70 family RNA polymerase sigma factor [Spirochaetota bacterium]|nr:sigma-70 family RNA polymerase sigma factor [Spirochaetota bacterium]
MTKKKDLFTEMHSKYYPLIFSAVYTKVDNVDDAKDICQEVFIKFFEKFGEIENYRKWLYGALRLAVFDFYRKSRPNINIDEVFDDISLTFVNGFRESRIIINEAIENMDNFDNETDKIMFDLIAINNFTYAQTAKQLGLTRRQVEYKYKKITDRIIDYLRKKGIDNLEDLL